MLFSIVFYIFTRLHLFQYIPSKLVWIYFSLSFSIKTFHYTTTRYQFAETTFDIPLYLFSYTLSLRNIAQTYREIDIGIHIPKLHALLTRFPVNELENKVNISRCKVILPNNCTLFLYYWVQHPQKCLFKILFNFSVKPHHEWCCCIFNEKDFGAIFSMSCHSLFFILDLAI